MPYAWAPPLPPDFNVGIAGWQGDKKQQSLGGRAINIEIGGRGGIGADGVDASPSCMPVYTRTLSAGLFTEGSPGSRQLIMMTGIANILFDKLGISNLYIYTSISLSLYIYICIYTIVYQRSIRGKGDGIYI